LVAESLPFTHSDVESQYTVEYGKTA